ncbi:hypothetical protein CALCODRAFT_73994 [Calocera cornea HHB12733]|uniref:Nucleotidyltransferase family protein n=1 Tax=Calocera cornea HHB12733 TaxID=1353952 RepID=A0A165IUB9_9BASI|nr:hypothetical protein CALCODRAFT_73994 [Calocera cornea HHB12733]
MQRLQTQGFDYALVHFDLRGTVELTPRSDLSRLGVLMTSQPDLLNTVCEVGKLSLLDVQHLRSTCHQVRDSLENEPQHRLRAALARYFPGAVDSFAAMLKKCGAVVGGSLVLSVLKPGTWTPSDLDIILPDHTCQSFEAFLTAKGYTTDPQQQIQHAHDYAGTATAAAGRHKFRYVCYRHAEEKIDLCYICFPSPPASHILTYHSSIVMNFFDGWAIYCLFPRWTFAGQFAQNRYHMDLPARTERAIRKLLGRGFTDVGEAIQDWHPEAVSAEDGFIDAYKLAGIWHQKVTL